MSYPFDETILKWSEPIEITSDLKIPEYVDWSTPLARKKNPLPPMEKLPPYIYILNSIFQPRIFEYNQKKYIQTVSYEEPERKVVKIDLANELTKKLKDRQARYDQNLSILTFKSSWTISCQT